MASLQLIIEKHRSVIVEHDFFRKLEGEGTLDQVRRMVPRLAFFVLAFQDLLRIAWESCRDPNFRSLLQAHASEERHHDQWYLSDLERLGVSCGLGDIFSAEHRIAREVIYVLTAEVQGAKSDLSRLAVVLCLESIGAEFFGRMIGFLERMGQAEGLLFFGKHHQQAEDSHGNLVAFAVPEPEMAEVTRTVDRTFGAMGRLADELARTM
jgi:hypothetical protein